MALLVAGECMAVDKRDDYATAAAAPHSRAVVCEEFLLHFVELVSGVLLEEQVEAAGHREQTLH
jgi:hypothetical protein